MTDVLKEVHALCGQLVGYSGRVYNSANEFVDSFFAEFDREKTSKVCRKESKPCFIAIQDFPSPLRFLAKPTSMVHTNLLKSFRHYACTAARSPWIVLLQHILLSTAPSFLIQSSFDKPIFSFLFEKSVVQSWISRIASLSCSSDSSSTWINIHVSNAFS